MAHRCSRWRVLGGAVPRLIGVSLSDLAKYGNGIRPCQSLLPAI